MENKYKVGCKVRLTREVHYINDKEPNETYVSGSIFTIERYAKEEPYTLYCVIENNRFWTDEELEIVDEPVCGLDYEEEYNKLLTETEQLRLDNNCLKDVISMMGYLL